MVDRVFAGILLLVTICYGYIAFTIIKAPFQYDPLGPESWPQILCILSVISLLILMWKPDVESFDTKRPTWIKLAIVTVLLFAYAELYEPLGFIIATVIFTTFMSRLLQATWLQAAVFGVTLGVLGYLICTGLLGLNLPSGPFPKL
ncbi:MAG: hypothetical protein COB24_09525 [Hyphomicrobiales bacterium]|nr:MAG: hypothetical protein COB24_09525 [Hyphomicrobiales bacterium]